MTRNKLFTIGVTGISGSGTSSVAKILAGLGGYAIEADMLARAVMQSGQPAFDEILAVFGDEILANGEIDRRALGALVFGKADEMKKLEKIIHPKVIAAIERLLAVADGVKFAVIDAPLLIESGLNKICHETWLVTAPDEKRIQRIMQRDGIDYEYAKKRLSSRKTDEELRQYVDIVIENDSGQEALMQKVSQSLREEYKTAPEDFTQMQRILAEVALKAL